MALDDDEFEENNRDWIEASIETHADRLLAEGAKTCPDCQRINRTVPLIPNLDPLRKAYEASRLRHPNEWKPSSGRIDEVDGRFLALAFNAMHLLLDDLTPPKRAKKVMQDFHEDNMSDVQFFVPEFSE